jgi:hypothetical protein
VSLNRRGKITFFFNFAQSWQHCSTLSWGARGKGGRGQKRIGKKNNKINVAEGKHYF